jgi:hypothetical protein
LQYLPVILHGAFKIRTSRELEMIRKFPSIAFVIPLFLPSVFFTGCVTDSDSSPHVISGQTYTDRQLGYSLVFPASWEAKVDQVFGDVTADVVIKAPAVGNFSANMNALRSAKNSGQTLQDRLDEEAAGAQTQYSATILSKQINNRGSIPVAELLITWNYGGNNLKQKLLLFERGTVVVGLTFTDLAAYFDANTGLSAIDASLTFQ